MMAAMARQKTKVLIANPIISFEAHVEANIDRRFIFKNNFCVDIRPGYEFVVDAGPSSRRTRIYR
jgi:hypothetical protein